MNTKEYNKAYYEANKDKHNTYTKAYLKANPKRQNQNDLKRKQRDPWFKRVKTCRSVLSTAVKRYILTGKGSSATIEKMVGITLEALVKQLEAHCNKRGFNLSDYGSTWQIDHISPVAAYEELMLNSNLNLEETLKLCFNHKNLSVKSPYSNKKHDETILNLRKTNSIKRMGA